MYDDEHFEDDDWETGTSSINGHQPMTDREMLCFANGSLRAIENMSLDRMRDEVTRLREDIKKHLGVE